MTIAIILVVAALGTLIVILTFTVSQGLQSSGRTGPATEIRPMDVAAFRNLVDPAEDDYLRRRLPASDFRLVRRERLRAMAAYVQLAKRNAEVLVRIAQNSTLAADAQTAEAARRLEDHAHLLQRNCTFAIVKIYIALAWPNSSLAAAPVLQGYKELNNSAMLLGRLQNPAATMRI
jgi:hypothetical protein